jgi:hypothetical protein
MYGYLVQPDALRFYGPRRLTQLAMKLLPRPDLVVNLTAPVHVIARRVSRSVDAGESEVLAMTPAS